MLQNQLQTHFIGGEENHNIIILENYFEVFFFDGFQVFGRFDTEFLQN